MAYTEPSSRFSHYSATVGEHLYVFGGRTIGFEKEKSELASQINIFNWYTEIWQIRETIGKPHPGYYSGACTSSGHHLYLYGGWDGSYRQNSLSQLDTDSLEWSELPNGPTKKIGCEMISYEGKLILFGGYGIPSSPTQPGSEFIQDILWSDGTGWTNELHCFEGTWSSPAVTGTRPPPCSDFSLTKVDDHHAVLFGGYALPAHTITDYVFILDLAKMDWSILKKGKGDPWPQGRNFHAAACLGFGGDHPQLLVIGGVSNNRMIQSVIAWILDIQAEKWKEGIAKPSTLYIPDGSLARFRHSATTFNISPVLTRVTLFGGSAGKTSIADTIVLQFEYRMCQYLDGPPIEKWILTNMTDSSELGLDLRFRAPPIQGSAGKGEVIEIHDEGGKKGTQYASGIWCISGTTTGSDREDMVRIDKQQVDSGSKAKLSERTLSLMEKFDLKEEDYCKEVTDAHLEEFTRDYGEGWRSIPAYLEMKSIMVRDAERKLGGERERRHAFFTEWKILKGSDATYKKLVNALLETRKRSDAEALCMMLQRSRRLGSVELSTSVQAAFIATGNEVSSLDASIKSDLMMQLRRDYKTIGVKYASYVRCIRMSLQEQGVSGKDLYSFLLSLPFEYDQSTNAELRKAKTLEDIFIALERYFSFWDHEIFQYLIEEYDLDQSKKKLQYVKHFESYVQKHKVSEFIAVNPLLSKCEAESSESKELTLKFDINVIHCSLARVNELKEVVATSLNMKPSTMRLLSIQDGCMEVTFLTPAYIADAIFIGDWKRVSEHAEELQVSSVMSVTCNGKTFSTKGRTIRATNGKGAAFSSTITMEELQKRSPSKVQTTTPTSSVIPTKEELLKRSKMLATQPTFSTIPELQKRSLLKAQTTPTSSTIPELQKRSPLKVQTTPTSSTIPELQKRLPLKAQTTPTSSTIPELQRRLPLKAQTTPTSSIIPPTEEELLKRFQKLQERSPLKVQTTPASSVMDEVHRKTSPLKVQTLTSSAIPTEEELRKRSRKLAQKTKLAQQTKVAVLK